jgi:hypothetical protein
MARQGDVLIIGIAGKLPLGAREVQREGGSVILMHGEATGHAHRIRSPNVTLFEAGDERLLRVDAPSDLVHEEHAPIHLEPGLYKIVRQREYQPRSKPRWVLD